MAKRHSRQFQDGAMKEIAKTLDELSGRYSRWEIWQDFVTMSAIAISNSVDTTHREAREKIYLDRAKKYQPEELQALAHMLAIVANSLDENPDQDFLGEIYMGLNFGDDHAGQFFTPYHISRLMAEVEAENSLAAQVKQDGWVGITDPCCGGGGLLVAFANVCRARGINYQTSVLFAAQDIDCTVAMMCYIQLSLLGCAGYVTVGDSLAGPMVSCGPNGLFVAPGDNTWFTPMYFRDIWHHRRLLATLNAMMSQSPDPNPTDKEADT